MSVLETFKSLSEEERVETLGLLDSDDSFAQQFQSGIDQLTAADKAELQSLMLGEPIDVTKVPKGQIEQKLITEIPKEESFQDSVVGLHDTVVDGISNAVEGAGQIASSVAESVADFGESFVNSVIPSQVSSAVVGAIEGVKAGVQGEDPLSAASKGFAQGELALAQGKLKRNQRSPLASGVGEVTGEVAVTIGGTSALASKAIPVVSKVVKSISASEKVLSASKLGVVTGSDFIVGALQLEAQKGEHGIESMAESMEKSAMYTMFGASVGVTIRKGIPVVSKWARNKSFKDLQASRGNQKLFTKNKEFLAKSKFYDSTKSTISEDDFIKALDDTPGYNEAMLEGNYFEANKYVAAQHGKLVEKKSALFSELDANGVVAEKDAVINTLAEINSKIFVGKQIAGDVSINATRKAHISGILQDLTESPNTKISLREADNILDDIQDVSKILKKNGEGDKLLGRLRASINGPVENAAKKSDLKSLSDSFIKTNKDIRITRSSTEISDKILSELNDVSSQGTIGQILGEVSDSFKTIRGSAGAAAGASVGFAVAGPAGSTVAVGLQALHTAGKSAAGLRTIVNGVDSATAGVEKMAKVAEFYTIGGGRRTKTGQTLISSLGRAINEGESNEELSKRVSIMADTASLLQSPMERTTKSFYAKKDALISLVAGIDPEMGKQLTSIVESGEDVGPFMEQIANHPKASEIFTPGQGWDGKTYDPALKQQIKQQILLQPLVPSAQRNKILEDLEVSGTIPDVNNLPKREPRK